MRWIDVIRLATRSFRTNRLRTFLTVLAVSVATAAILFLVSFGYGLQLLTVNQIANSATISTIDVTPSSSKALVQLDNSAQQRIAEIPKVVTVAPELDLEGQAQFTSLGPAVVHAIPTKYFELADVHLDNGAYFTGTESHKAVASPGFLAQFSLDTDGLALGKQFFLTYNVGSPDQSTTKTKAIKDPVPYTITGIATDPDASLSYIYVPITDALNLVSGVNFSNIKVQATSRDTVLSVKDEINSLGYQASAPLDTLQQLDRVFAIVQITLGILGVIALVISSIGMFNTMTISLLERTKEIGVMKALGADKKDIWKMFLAESTIIGFMGGITGVALGLILALLSNTVLNLLAVRFGGQAHSIFYSPPWFIVAIILFSTFIGMITGFYPAKRASRLNPLVALRYE